MDRLLNHPGSEPLPARFNRDYVTQKCREVLDDLRRAIQDGGALKEGEIETGDGTKKRFGPGDIMLADDLTGRGHITRAVGNKPRLYAQIPLKK